MEQLKKHLDQSQKLQQQEIAEVTKTGFVLSPVLQYTHQFSFPLCNTHTVTQNEANKIKQAAVFKKKVEQVSHEHEQDTEEAEQRTKGDILCMQKVTEATEVCRTFGALSFVHRGALSIVVQYSRQYLDTRPGRFGRLWSSGRQHTIS
jgi:hypothetical protein